MFKISFLQLQLLEICAHEKLIRNSSLIPIESSKVYEWNIQFCPILGSDTSAYAMIGFFDGDELEILRRRKFFNNFSGKEQTLTLRCAVPLHAKFALLGFRVNCEEAQPCDTKVKLPEIHQCVLQETENTEEDYDDIFDYAKLYEETDLNKEPWKAVGGPQRLTGKIEQSKDKIKIL